MREKVRSLLSAPKRFLAKGLKQRKTKQLTSSLFYVDTALNETPKHRAYGDMVDNSDWYMKVGHPDCPYCRPRDRIE